MEKEKYIFGVLVTVMLESVVGGWSPPVSNLNSFFTGAPAHVLLLS